MPRAASLLALLLLPSSVFAASGGTLSGSGSTAPTWPGDAESQTVQGQRLERSGTFRLDLKGDSKADLQYREKKAAYLKERAEARRECREDLRRSNRDTRLPVLLRCYEEELRDETQFLAIARARLEAMPGVSATVRQNALDRADLLKDALSTVTFAIGSGVYASTEDVAEAKLNLLNRYRMPYWDAMAMLRADRALTAAGAFILKLDAVRAAEEKAGGTRLEWSAIRTCLTDRETALRTLSQAGIASDRAAKVITASDELSGCIAPIRGLLSPATTGSGSTNP